MSIILLFAIIIKPSDLQQEREKQSLLNRGNLMARMFLHQVSQEKFMRVKVSLRLSYLFESRDYLVLPFYLTKGWTRSRGTVRLNR